MADEIEFLYSGGLENEPSNKESFLKKLKNLLKKHLKSYLPEERRLKHLPQLLSKKERYLILGLSLVIIFSIIAIPVGYYFNITKDMPDFGGRFSEGMIGEPRFINPLLLQTDTDRDLAQLVYSGLLKNDGKGNFVPDLAEAFNISDDGLVYTFILKKDIRWHNGRIFTADDIIFTIKTAQNPDFTSPQRINWQGVEVVKIDDYTVEFRLKNPYAQFVNNLTLGILPSHLWQDVRAANFVLSELNLKPVGTGPYQFSKLRKNKLGRITSYELTANENYHLEGPYIESIQFKFYSTEEELVQSFNLSGVDNLGGISPANLKNLRFPGKLEIKKLKIPRYFAVFFNQNQSDVLSDKNVRLALAHSVNKDKIIESLDGNGLKVNSPILPEIFSDFNTNIKIYDYNPNFAKQILENSEWQDKDGDQVREKGGRKLEIDFVVPLRKELIEVGGLLKKDWEEIGMRINLINVPVIELQQNYIQPRNYEMLLFGEVLNVEPDPFSFWHSSQKKDPGLNLALYDNQGADKLLEEARQTLNPITRASKYNDFQNLVIEDLPSVFLYSPTYIYPQTKKINGFKEDLLGLPSERFVNIHQWYIKTERVRK